MLTKKGPPDLFVVCLATLKWLPFPGCQSMLEKLPVAMHPEKLPVAMHPEKLPVAGFLVAGLMVAASLNKP